MAKGQTKQATQMSKDIYNQAPQTYSPITSPLEGLPAEARAGYENLATTGGLGGGEGVDYMNAATSSIAGTNRVLQEQLNRQRAAQGQGAGGGEYEALSRLSAQQQADANLKAATNLNQLRIQGQEAGLAGERGLTQQLFAALVAQTGSQEEAASIMEGLSRNPGTFGNILNAIGAVSGAGSISGGGGAPIGWSI